MALVGSQIQPIYNGGPWETSTQHGHRYIPPVEQYYESVKVNIPANLATRDHKLIKAGLITTYTKSYDEKPLDDGTRLSKGKPISNVKYLDSTKTRFFSNPPRPMIPQISTMKDSYSPKYLPRAHGMKDINYVNPDAYCRLQTSGRSEQPPLPPEEKGYLKLLDPYLTTTRKDHVPFTKAQWDGIGKKNVLTVYDYLEPKIPKCKGFGVKQVPLAGQIVPFKIEPIADKRPFQLTGKLKYFPLRQKSVPNFGMESEMKSQYQILSPSEDISKDSERNCVQYRENWPRDLPWELVSLAGIYESEYSRYGSACPTSKHINQDCRKKITH